MRLPGYCQVCHKVRQVRVTRPMPGTVQVGTCSQCEQKEEDRRWGH